MRQTTRYSTTPARSARALALGAAIAVFASACGSTAYRDRQLEIAAEANGSSTGVAAPSLDGLGSSETTTGDAVTETADGTTSTTGGTVVSDGASSTSTTGTSGGGSSSTTGSADTGSSGTTGGTSGTSTSGTSGTSGAATTGGGTQMPQSAENSRGVTDDEIHIGFMFISSFQQLGSQLSNNPPEKGDIKGQINTLVKWINDNGGIAGRKIVPHVRSYKQEESSPGLEQQLCTGFADDDKVFAVFMVGMIQESTRYCYASKRVIAIDMTAFTFDSTVFNETAPYYWSLGTPVYDPILRALPGALDAQGYFDPMPSRDETETKVGVLIWDTPYTKRLAQRDLTPALQAVGQDIDVLRTVDGATIGTMQRGLSDAVVAFRDAGVNRVMFIGSSPLAPFFMNQAENEEYRPRYGLTSLEQPRFAANPDEGQVPLQAVDAMGLGFAPDVDVEDDQHAWPSPSNKTEQLCLQVLRADGHDWSARKNANIGVGYCGGLLMLKKGAETITDGLTPELWAYHAERNLVGFESPLNFASTFGQGDHTAPESYRPIRWYEDCGCFKYSGPEVRFQ